MRMWMVSPKLLCDKHLLGEHYEIHKFRHVFVKQQDVSGRLGPVVQIVPSEMQARHDELVVEFGVRGFRHKSPYQQPDVSYLPVVSADVEYNMQDLLARCDRCAEIARLYFFEPWPKSIEAHEKEYNLSSGIWSRYFTQFIKLCR